MNPHHGHRFLYFFDYLSYIYSLNLSDSFEISTQWSPSGTSCKIRHRGPPRFFCPDRKLPLTPAHKVKSQLAWSDFSFKPFSLHQ